VPGSKALFFFSLFPLSLPRVDSQGDSTLLGKASFLGSDLRRRIPGLQSGYLLMSRWSNRRLKRLATNYCFGYPCRRPVTHIRVARAWVVARRGSAMWSCFCDECYYLIREEACRYKSFFVFFFVFVFHLNAQGRRQCVNASYFFPQLTLLEFNREQVGRIVPTCGLSKQWLELIASAMAPRH
jgi:hypothetical protein